MMVWKPVIKALVLLVAIAVIGVLSTLIWIGSRGISAKAQPGRVETVVARTMRRLAIPRAARALENPVAASPEVIREGMTHYADHCANCHANDGTGETELGRGLYPKPPDMRLEPTQSLTDGELFYIIENGVRLTGMPAWSTGTEDGTQSTWHLVHFIRQLPRLTPEHIEQMKALNPRSAEEWRQELEEQEFLGGGPDTPKTSPPAPHQH
jgi:mono/diheme cytochrome c family protein